MISAPNIPLPMLVTGLTGVAGFNAFEHFRRRYPGQVIGLRRESNWPLQGPGVVACDSDDAQGLGRLFERYRFRSVLNTFGNCALKSCELAPRMAWQTNVLAIQSLLQVLEHHPARLVHLSIDLVFSGDGRGDHREPDNTDPVTVYGKTMSIAEQLVMLARPDACVLRISLPMGVSYSGHAGAIDWIQSRFQADKPATLYFDEVRTPTYTECMNKVFAEVFRGDLAGLYHCGGPRRLSLFQIAQIVNRVGGYDPRNLIGCFRKEAGPVPPRAGNVTMNSERLADALGTAPFDPWPFGEIMVPTHPQWHYDRSSDFAGSPELLAEVLYRNPGRAAKAGHA